MPNILFTSDTHFNHWSSPERNIIEYCHRPFKTIEEMNETIIERWNQKVDYEDTVYHLGDFGFGPCYDICTRLKGKIYLIPGGHDRTPYYRVTPIEPLKTITIAKQPVVLCHYCVRAWDRSHYNSIHLYGHSHGRLEPIGKSHDVGVDTNGFSPLSWDEIVEIMKNKPDNPNLITNRNNHG